jgi:hypothetical protein
VPGFEVRRNGLTVKAVAQGFAERIVAVFHESPDRVRTQIRDLKEQDRLDEVRELGPLRAHGVVLQNSAPEGGAEGSTARARDDRAGILEQLRALWPVQLRVLIAATPNIRAVDFRRPIGGVGEVPGQQRLDVGLEPAPPRRRCLDPLLKPVSPKRLGALAGHERPYDRSPNR